MFFVPILILALLTVPTNANAPDTPDPEPIEESQHIEPVPVVEIEKPLPETDITHTEAACNCYNLLKENFQNPPSMREIQDRATTTFGNVAVFMYAPTPDFPHGLPHVAMTTGNMGVGTFEIEEYNYHECKRSSRYVSFTDPRLMGFTTLPSPSDI